MTRKEIKTYICCFCGAILNTKESYEHVNQTCPKRTKR